MTRPSRAMPIMATNSGRATKNDYKKLPSIPTRKDNNIIIDNANRKEGMDFEVFPSPRPFSSSSPTMKNLYSNNNNNNKKISPFEERNTDDTGKKSPFDFQTRHRRESSPYHPVQNMDELDLETKDPFEAMLSALEDDDDGEKQHNFPSCSSSCATSSSVEPLLNRGSITDTFVPHSNKPFCYSGPMMMMRGQTSGLPSSMIGSSMTNSNKERKEEKAARKEEKADDSKEDHDYVDVEDIHAEIIKTFAFR